MRTRTIRNREQAIGQTTDIPAIVHPSAKVALTEVEAARYIGMSAAWLKKSRTARFRRVVDAPAFVRAGAKRIVYRRDDLDEWLESHLEQVGRIADAQSVVSRESMAD